jgi:PIN domain nuclease of toxin-antitoxin system
VNLLLDTHVLLWAGLDSRRLSPRARDLLADPDQSLWVSAISAWEITTKVASGKLRLDIPAEQFFERALVGLGYADLAITHRHAFVAGSLPRHHGDLADRILIGQSLVEGFTLVSADATLRRYPVPVIW